MSADGSRIIVGAPRYNGYVQVFEWTGSAWTLLGQTILYNHRNSYFGTSVAMSGNGLTIAIGTESAESRGEAEVYVWNPDSVEWDLVSTILSNVTSSV